MPAFNVVRPKSLTEVHWAEVQGKVLRLRGSSGRVCTGVTISVLPGPTPDDVTLVHFSTGTMPYTEVLPFSELSRWMAQGILVITDETFTPCGC